MIFEVIDLVNGEVFVNVYSVNCDDFDVVVVSVWIGQKVWVVLIIVECLCILLCVVVLLCECNDVLVVLESCNIGKLLSEIIVVDIVIGVDVLEYYVGVMYGLEGS